MGGARLHLPRGLGGLKEDRNFPSVTVRKQTKEKVLVLQQKQVCCKQHWLSFNSNPQTHGTPGFWPIAQAYTTVWTALNLGFRSFLLAEMNSSTLQDALLAILSTSAKPWMKETLVCWNCEGRVGFVTFQCL